MCFYFNANYRKEKSLYFSLIVFIYKKILYQDAIKIILRKDVTSKKKIPLSNKENIIWIIFAQIY